MNIDCIMDLDGLDSCNICMETYDGNIRPHSLPCGHTICSCCITNYVKKRYLKCPHCQRSHNATSVNDFPVNFDTETLIDKLKEAKQEAAKRSATSNGAKSLKSRIKDVMSEQKKSLRTMVKMSESNSSEIKDFKKFLQGRKRKHDEVTTKIFSLLQQNKKMIKQVESEEERIDIIGKEGEKYNKEANDNLSCDEDHSEMMNIMNTSEKLEKIYENLESWNDKCKMHQPCKEMISSLSKIEEGLEDVLTVIHANKLSEMSSDLQEKQDLFLSLMEKVRKIQADSNSGNSELKKSMKFLLRRDQLGASQFKDGQMRYARVTVKNGKTYLHCLQDGISPSFASVKHSDLVKTLDKESVVAFLDLSWGGSFRGRVHILLSNDTPLARHFKALCSGELGPSYKNTKFLKKIGKRDSYIGCRYVTGGDYEKNNGSGGAPLFTGLKIDDQIYHHKMTIGCLQAAYYGNDGPMSAQFRIHTTTMEGGVTDGIFGQVQDGLEIVRDAVKLGDIKEVTISDCGIVLPL